MWYVTQPDLAIDNLCILHSVYFYQLVTAMLQVLYSVAMPNIVRLVTALNYRHHKMLLNVQLDVHCSIFRWLYKLKLKTMQALIQEHCGLGVVQSLLQASCAAHNGNYLSLHYMYFIHLHTNCPFLHRSVLGSIPLDYLEDISLLALYPFVLTFVKALAENSIQPEYVEAIKVWYSAGILSSPQLPSQLTIRKNLSNFWLIFYSTVANSI